LAARDIVMETIQRDQPIDRRQLEITDEPDAVIKVFKARDILKTPDG
jgi:dTDP-glucose pyrophosphorylase